MIQNRSAVNIITRAFFIEFMLIFDKIKCIMIIDTHAHLNFAAYKNDLGEVVKRTLAEDVWMINVGSKYETSKKAVEIAEKYEEGIFASIGLHPIYSATEFAKRMKTDSEEGSFAIREEIFNKDKYKELAKSEKVVAVGEIGLDYYYRPKSKTKLGFFKEKQKQVFINQLDLAKELNLPVIFHCRMAHDDLIEVLKSRPGIKGVIHCFTGNWEQAEKYLEMGFSLGINGIIFKLDLDEIVKKIPLEKILVETDCPYLTPPKAGRERNEPLFVKYVIEKIAEIRNEDYQEIAEATTLNAKNLFKI